MANEAYKWLTRRRRRARGFYLFITPKSSLLLGADHLLKVESSLFAENYKRFYFRDIQMLTVRTTRRRLFWNIGLVVSLVLSLAEGLWGTPELGAWAVFMFIIAVTSGLLLVVNNLLGTACEVRIQTAVHVEDLPPLSRVHRSRRILDQIRPLIAAAQGEITPEQAAEGVRQASGVRQNARGATATGPFNL